MVYDNAWVAWPPHSYANIYFIQEHYESVEMSRQMADQPRLPPTLHHKGYFVYECLLRRRSTSQYMHVHALLPFFEHRMLSMLRNRMI